MYGGAAVSTNVPVAVSSPYMHRSPHTAGHKEDNTRMTQTITPQPATRTASAAPTTLRPDEVAFLHRDDALDRSLPAVETRELRKEYANKVAVESLTLTVPQGEVFGFLGPNGAGKSTTMKMLMGLVFPTSGEMRLLGKPVGDVSVKSRVGFLPEQFRFYEWMQAGEFLDFHGRLYGMTARDRKRRIPEVLDLVGLEREGKNRLKTFSKGMLQRVGLAQAVMNNPALVFLDEPTSALDPVGRREVRDIVARLHSEGMTVFLNSHILAEVEQICDRCAIIHHGRVARIGTMRELLADAFTVDVTLADANEAAQVALPDAVTLLGPSADGRTLSVRVPDEEAVPLLVSRLVEAGARVYAVTPHRRTLEDVFMEAIGANGAGEAHGLEREAVANR